MILQSLTLQGVKGYSSVTLQLAPLTIITGPNMSGKTALLDAIRFLLQGYVPKFGKRNQDTFRMASGNRMRVDGLFHNGVGTEALYRELTLSRGSVSAASSIEKGRNLGSAMLDPDVYFSLTPTERTAYVFGHVRMPDQFTPDGIVARLQSIRLEEGHTEAFETAKQDVIQTVRDEIEEAETVADALTTLVGDTLKKQFTAWNQAAKDSEGSVRVLEELRLQEEGLQQHDLPSLENERQRLIGLRDEATGERARLQQQAVTHQNLLNRAAFLRERLDAPYFDFSDELRVLEERLAALDQKREELNAQLDAIEDKRGLTELDSDIEGRRMSIAAGANNRIAADKAAETFKQRIADIEQQPCCPTCKGKAKGWQKHVVAEWQASMEKEIERATAIRSELDSLAKEQERDMKLRHRRAELSTAMAATLTDERNATAQRQQILDGEARKQQELDRDKAELDALQLPDAAPSATDIDVLSTRITGYSTSIQQIEQQQQAARRLQQDIERQTQAVQKHEDAVTRAKAIKEVGTTLKAIRDEIQGVAFESLMETANGICGTALGKPLAYSVEHGEVGYHSPNGFVTRHTFSGAEERLAYVATAAALSAGAECRILLLDEATTMTPSVLDMALDRLAAAVKNKTLEQVIVVIPSDEDETDIAIPDGWTQIHTGALGQAAAPAQALLV